MYDSSLTRAQLNSNTEEDSVNALQVPVTVVVPVRNEEPFLASTLDQLIDQDLEGIDLEILVVDGQSTDKTREIAQRYIRRYLFIRLIENPKRLSSAARNLAIQQSRGDYFVVIDGHCEIPSRRYFRDLVEAFDQSGADCLGRPQPLDVTKATNLQRAIALARSSRLGHYPGSLVYTGKEVDCRAISVAVAYRRSVFEELGQFDERFDACEDCDLNHRIDQASLKCRLIPKLTVKYQPRNSLSGLFQQQYRYGRGRVRLMRKHPDSFYNISILPAVILAIIAGAIACWPISVLRILFIAVIAIYIAIVSVVSIWKLIRRRDATLLLWLPLVFVTIHLGAGTGILAETLAGWRQKP